MKKYLKNLLTACLAVCITVCVGIFAAGCTHDDEGTIPDSVSITVKLDNGDTVEGVRVQICSDLLCLEGTTNGQGIATISIKGLDSRIYQIHIKSGVPEGYAYLDNNGTDYGTENGINIDVTKTSAFTVTLKAVS